MNQAGGGLPGGRALVVEDDGVIAVELRDMLLAAGFSAVDIAHTPAETTAAATGAYAVAVLDVMLAGGDSLEAAAILQRRGVPIVFATALGERLPAAFAAAPVLWKPYSEYSLREALARALGGRGPVP